MELRKATNLAALFIAGILITACDTSRQVTSQFSNGVDSIKVEVSTQVSTNHFMLTDRNKAIVKLMGKPEYALPNKTTKKLKALAENLFVKQTEDIILSEEEASGRTSHPIFTVTLYRNGNEEVTRYKMGTESNGITQCTTKNIRYSNSFREFMFSALHILH